MTISYYICNRKINFDSPLASFLELSDKQASGAVMPLPYRKNNKNVAEGRYDVIDFPVDEPTSLFATDLVTCSACIYIYPGKEKDSIARIVLYHAPASIITSDYLPTSPLFNVTNHAAEDIKVIIGTPNKHNDSGVNETIESLKKANIDEKNIYLYSQCETATFGIDSEGCIGERICSFDQYANRALRNILIEIMNDSLNEYKQQPIFAQSDSAGLYPRHSKTGGKKHAEDFSRILKSTYNQTLGDVVFNYLKNNKTGNLTQHSLKTIFLKKVNELLNAFSISPIPLSPPSLPAQQEVEQAFNALNQCALENKINFKDFSKATRYTLGKSP